MSDTIFEVSKALLALYFLNHPHILGEALLSVPGEDTSVPRASRRQDPQHWEIPQCRQAVWSVVVVVEYIERPENLTELFYLGMFLVV